MLIGLKSLRRISDDTSGTGYYKQNESIRKDKLVVIVIYGNTKFVNINVFK